jgi:hypothetical protein
MLVEYFLSRRFGREFDSPHLHEVLYELRIKYEYTNAKIRN